MLKQPEYIGRDMELSGLKASLQDAINGRGSTIFISGEAGIGKTRLVTELIREVRGARVLKGWCLAESLEPLMPIRSALREAGQEHLVSGKPPPLVLSAYLMNDAGILLAKAEREESELDPHIFASMLRAVSDFVHDSMKAIDEGEPAGGLKSMGYRDFNILIEDLGGLHLACVTKGALSEVLINDIRELLSKVQDKFGEVLDDWSGRMDEVEGIEPLVSRLVNSGKYDGRFLVDDPRILQENLFDNVLLGIRRLSMEEPIILFLDDLQWADPTTLNLIHYLARNTRQDRVLIVGTYRPEDILEGDEGKPHYLASSLQKMSREDLLDSIDLHRLDPQETGKLIGSALGTASFEERFYDRVYQETEGVPLFILELMRLLVQDRSILRNEEGVWTLESDVDTLDIPSIIYDVVNRRLGRLQKDQRWIMGCASVIGLYFTTDVLIETTGIQKMELLRHLTEIEGTHQIVRYVKGRYRFDHAKIREVLYNGMGEELRKECHRLVADAIAHIQEERLDEYVGQLAHHYFMAEDMRALDFLVKAGEKARMSCAYEEAIEYIGTAISMLEQDIKDDDQIQQKYLELSMKMGWLYYWLGDTPSALPYYEGILEESRKLGDKDTEAEALLYLARIHGLSGHYAQAEEFFNGSRQICIERDDTKGLVDVERGLGYVHWRKGENDEAISHYNHSIKNSMATGDISGMARTFIELGNVYNHWGEHKKAIDYYMMSITELEKLDDHPEISRAYNNLGDSYLQMRDWERAIESLERCREAAEKVCNKNLIAWAHFNSAEALAHRGELEKAEEALKLAQGIFRTLDDKFGMEGVFKNYGIVMRLKGDHHGAIVHLYKSLELAKSLDIPHERGTTYKELAKTYEAMGDLRKAMDNYRVARDLFAGIGSNNEAKFIDKRIGELEKGI